MGVVIAMEDFFIADGLAVAAGILICLKFAAETNLRGRDRKLGIFLIAFSSVVAIVGADIRWTAHKQREAVERKEQLSQLFEIPKLQRRLQLMEDAQTKESQNRQLKQAEDGQKLDDIESENEGLRRSVETKDAALVSIAKNQYALNFFPQLAITTNGSPDIVYVQNNGKTNVEIYKLIIDGQTVFDASWVQTIAPGSSSTYRLNEAGKKLLLAQNMADSRVSRPGIAFVSTLDKRRYKMGFTWVFVVKDNKIDTSFAIDGPVVPES